jgi:hypothetical protein
VPTYRATEQKPEMPKGAATYRATEQKPEMPKGAATYRATEQKPEMPKGAATYRATEARDLPTGQQKSRPESSSSCYLQGNKVEGPGRQGAWSPTEQQGRKPHMTKRPRTDLPTGQQGQRPEFEGPCYLQGDPEQCLRYPLPYLTYSATPGGIGLDLSEMAACPASSPIRQLEPATGQP